MFCIVIFVSLACWEAVIMNHFLEGIILLLCLMAVILIISLMQQYLLWLLPKKERSFWQKSIF